MQPRRILKFDYKSCCSKSADYKHEWENVVDPDRPDPVQVMPLIWGAYRIIRCKHCLGKRKFDGKVATNEIE